MTRAELVAKWPRERAKALHDLMVRLQVCECGTEGLFWETVEELLEVAEDHEHRGSFYDGGREFGAKVLDAWGLLDHGAGIGAAWLEADGELLLDFLRDFGCVMGASETEPGRTQAPDSWPIWASMEGVGWDAWELWANDKEAAHGVEG